MRRRTWPLCLGGVVCALLLRFGTVALRAQPDETGVAEEELSDDVREILEAGRKKGAEKGQRITADDVEAKPDHFESWGNRLDYIHDNLFIALNAEVIRWDSLGTKESEIAQPVPPSTFRATLEFEIRKIDGTYEAEVSPALRVDIRIPNLERRAKVFIDTQSLDNLPGSTLAEQDNQLRVGVGAEKKGRRNDLYSVNLGVKWRLPPVGFAEAKVSRLKRYDTGLIYPQVKGFYETDDGFGSLASLQGDKWFADHVLVQSVSSARWSETSRGVEWEQTFLFVNMLKYYKAQTYDYENVHRGFGLRTSINGYKTGSGIVDQYRVGIGYRFPLYKQWIYMTVLPELRWRNDADWDTEPGVRFSFDMLFWGTEQR